MTAPAGPAAKTERLLNLVQCLLYTRRPLPKQKIRQIVEAYRDAPSDEAFDRMFERDKDELRELGIPLVTEDLNSIWEDEPGYRIPQREYALPEVTFTADERAVLGLASRVWQQASLAGPAAEALRKLEADGIERDEATLVGLEPLVRTNEGAFDAVLDATLRQVPIAFAYRKPGTTVVEERHVEPWGVSSWRGRWYLTAQDADRGAPRVFRLSRIVGEVTPNGKPGTVVVPADHSPREMVRSAFSEEQEPSPAVLRVAVGAGHALRRRARTTGEVDDQWSLLDVDYRDLEVFASEIAEYGPSVVVEQPPELVDAVLARLRGALAAARTGGTPVGPGAASATATGIEEGERG